jgi:hypothetical protein
LPLLIVLCPHTIAVIANADDMPGIAIKKNLFIITSVVKKFSAQAA